MEFVTAINRIRRENRALHLYRNLRFYEADDPNIVWYGKMTPEGDNVVFVAANLDLARPACLAGRRAPRRAWPSPRRALRRCTSC